MRTHLLSLQNPQNYLIGYIADEIVKHESN